MKKIVIAFLSIFTFSQIYAIDSNMFIKNVTDINQTKTIKNKKTITYEKKLEDAILKLHNDLNMTSSDINITISKDYNAIGYYNNKLGKTEDALTNYLKAVAIIEKVKGPQSKTKSIYYNNLATAYEKLYKLSEALEYYKKTLKIYKDKLPKNHPYIATTSADIANIYEKLKNPKKSLEYHLIALKIRVSKVKPINHPDTLYSYQKVIQLNDELANYTDALLYGNRLMDIVSLSDEKFTQLLKQKLDAIEKSKREEGS